ncbi:winged helix-turn-helix domain-containing protein [Vibrio neptunius]|uniref:Winged helix-turn-helix transcriptional regulator n=1 Tax=Vibrio neptunius TaxID=170651 RepID=A0ABS2ZW94_9VIBR|nr:winged helix-turn-helix domain-containing protein [Vibrio neptunius]MBN3491880.1 winged helix-turn-helix transcriptional regulator [Vibrio neptunius]MBN3514425.1 winged helix-turn-helix transcriptional regulator [Vibrio neptunius]MBN3548460.1 winged helix-turn-helix transcriptional regulator [Vibrio neptunius]MBN3576506.1 winged helix-turn-helix transcriptional regulator [Vibrio neptunius]MCH9870170.1 winged helix-turn-helix transcriptional regulator [Vibrio neptunius]
MTKQYIDSFRIPFGNCILCRSDTGAEIILDANKSFSITLPESSVLKKLITEKGNVVSKDDLIVEAWGRPDVIGPNSLPVAITNLRKVLEMDNMKIVNVPRKGYRLDLSEHEPTLESVEKESKNINLGILESNLISGSISKVKLYLCFISTMVTLYSVFYIVFSWVNLDCYTDSKTTVCTIEGEEFNPQIMNNKSGHYFYSSHSGLMEVEQGG